MCSPAQRHALWSGAEHSGGKVCCYCIYGMNVFHSNLYSSRKDENKNTFLKYKIPFVSLFVKEEDEWIYRGIL